MKILGYLMPLIFMAWGITSEYFGLGEPVYYAAIGYLLGALSITFVSMGD